jgi:hypothetical protein
MDGILYLAPSDPRRCLAPDHGSPQHGAQFLTLHGSRRIDTIEWCAPVKQTIGGEDGTMPEVEKSMRNVS